MILQLLVLLDITYRVAAGVCWNNVFAPHGSWPGQFPEQECGFGYECCGFLQAHCCMTSGYKFMLAVIVVAVVLVVLGVLIKCCRAHCAAHVAAPTSVAVHDVTARPARPAHTHDVTPRPAHTWGAPAGNDVTPSAPRCDAPPSYDAAMAGANYNMKTYNRF